MRRSGPQHRNRISMSMGPLDALNHVANFLLPACLLGGLTAALSKLLWRRALRGVRWRALAGWAAAAAAAASVGGLVVVGRDGAMATYAAMVVAVAAALLWRGFLHPGARRAAGAVSEKSTGG